MIPGTVARKNPAQSRREANPTAIADETSAPTARQSAAEPWADDANLSRREYLQSIVPGLGAWVVSGLRNFENWKRDLRDKQ